MCRLAQLPLYMELHDPKIFMTVQKIYLWLYKVKKKLTLRALVDYLKSSKAVTYLHPCRVPMFTALSYFIANLPQCILDIIDDATQTLLHTCYAVIIYSTGFECTHPSHYYCRRINSPELLYGFITYMHSLFKNTVLCVLDASECLEELIISATLRTKNQTFPNIVK